MPSIEVIDDGQPPRGYAVRGFSNRVLAKGVFGESDHGFGVYGKGGEQGVHGEGTFIGVNGYSYGGTGVYGDSDSGEALYGKSNSSFGVYGESRDGDGVHGVTNSHSGVRGSCHKGAGVIGESDDTGTGVYGESRNGYGVSAYSAKSYGMYAHSDASPPYNFAAFLDGNVKVTGNLEIQGTLQKAGGSFKIDHPLDPANKYLCHSFVESPDMKNVYDGVVELDIKGEAEIELPDWFGALNKDFRYQLTAIGAPGPNLYIAEEIISDTTTDYSSSSNNKTNNSHFKIAGGAPGMKVSWHVTGIRKDPWANAHRIQVEEDKPANERGYYIYPELYGQPEENGISRLLFPEQKASAVHK